MHLRRGAGPLKLRHPPTSNVMNYVLALLGAAAFHPADRTGFFTAIVVS